MASQTRLESGWSFAAAVRFRPPPPWLNRKKVSKLDSEHFTQLTRTCMQS